MRAVPKRSFLGFLKFTCPSCRKTFLYPLTRGYRIAYWIVVVLVGVACIVGLILGEVVAPGLLAIAAAIALAKDHSVKTRVAKAEGLADAAGASAGSGPPSA